MEKVPMNITNGDKHVFTISQLTFETPESRTL